MLFCVYFNLILSSFPPRLAKTAPFVILLCLTPDDFTCQGRASGWERVKSICDFLAFFSHIFLIVCFSPEQDMCPLHFARSENKDTRYLCCPLTGELWISFPFKGPTSKCMLCGYMFDLNFILQITCGVTIRYVVRHYTTL